jgi:hypothetical protein
MLLLLGSLLMVRLLAPRWRGLMVGRAGVVMALGLAVLVSAAGSGSVRADQAAADSGIALDLGVRVGAMPVRLDAGKIDEGLGALGYGTVSASTDSAGIAGTVFVDYEFTAHAGVEVGYTYRDATAAHLHGTIGSAAELPALLQDTTDEVRSYGNIVSLSYVGHFDLAPRVSLEPRFGGFFWATKVTAVGFDDHIATTHEGGGVTLGLTAAYHLWRGLEVGVAVDHFRGFPSNIATLYSGSLEWRFGR